MAPSPSGAVVVSHATSPSDFYVRLRTHEDRLTSFHDSLATAMLHAESHPVKPEPGQSYAAAIAEPFDSTSQNSAKVSWRRVAVLAVSSSTPNQVQVRLVDVGCIKFLRCDDLRRFPADQPSFTSTPAFALPCRLPNVIPSASSPSWSKVACEFFASLVSAHPLFFVDFRQPDNTESGACAGVGGKAEMDLYVGVSTAASALDVGTKVALRVAQVLVEEELADWSADTADSGGRIFLTRAIFLTPGPLPL